LIELVLSSSHPEAGEARRGTSFVAQVSNLLYRRLPVGYTLNSHNLCGLEIRDTADWKSALQRRILP
jgi:hypothetical protein